MGLGVLIMIRENIYRIISVHQPIDSQRGLVRGFLRRPERAKNCMATKVIKITFKMEDIYMTDIIETKTINH